MMRFAVLIVALFAGAACGGRKNIQCEQDSNCDLSGGGTCIAGGTGMWCAYPDPACPSGYRYSDLDVEGSVSGQCVPDNMPDAGVDAAPPMDAPSAVPYSCVALPHLCGANGDDDCCNAPTVPGGTYYRSYDLAGDSLSGDMNSPATISSFRLDKYEVTVGRFRAFVAAGQGNQVKHPATGAGANPKIAGSGWDASWNASLPADTAALVAQLKCSSMYQTWTDTAGANETRPINCITWYEAMAFCAWDGGFLPTEAQWNFAATGGSDQRAYPWSNPASSTTLDATHASYYAGSSYCTGDGMSGCTIDDLVKVGTMTAGVGRWGHAEMTGNVDEWVLDFYGTYDSLCTDCANLVASANRVHRGGPFNGGGGILRTGFRQPAAPTTVMYSTGFRCAR